MTLTPKDLKKLTGLLNAYIFASYRDSHFDFDYDQPFENLCNEVIKIAEIKEFYDEDLFYWILEGQIMQRMGSPKNVGETEVLVILEHVRKTLLLNIANHVIVVPIPKADIRKVILFNNYMLLPHDLPRKEKIGFLAKFSGKKSIDTEAILDHTENSRSPDFSRYPLLCIKEKHQSSRIHFKALNLCRLTIYAITTYYYAHIHLNNNGMYSSVASLVRTAYPASHLVILAKDNWRQRHKPLNFDPVMRFTFGWLNEKHHQRKLAKFIRALILTEKADKLRILFLNSLTLFNEALIQNTSISILLLMTAAESLLTQTKNEKRLRLSAILPRIVQVNDISISKLSEILTELYLKRNDFVHAGKSITIMYSNKKDKDSLEIAKVAISMLLLSYPVIEKQLFNTLTINKKQITKDSMLHAWQHHIDSIFEDVIKGNTK